MLTDKTNSTHLLLVSDYTQRLTDHFLKGGDLSLFLDVIGMSEEANKFIDRVNMDLLIQEEQFVRQLLAT